MQARERLSEIIDSERGRIRDDHNNRFAFSFSKTITYYEFLEIIIGRFEPLSQNYASILLEYLHLLSREMGPEIHERMTSAGRGAVVRCCIPVGEAEEFCASLAELAVKHLFWIVDPEAPEVMYLEDHSPMLKRDIPPEWIEIEYLPE